MITSSVRGRPQGSANQTNVMYEILSLPPGKVFIRHRKDQAREEGPQGSPHSCQRFLQLEGPNSPSSKSRRTNNSWRIVFFEVIKQRMNKNKSFYAFAIRYVDAFTWE